MALDLASLKQSIQTLERFLNVANNDEEMAKLSPDQREAIRAGVIQSFEFTFELSWKFMDRWLTENFHPTATKGIPRKELFRRAAENGLVDNVLQWFDYQEKRNITVHAYSAGKANEIFERSQSFLASAKYLLIALENRND